MKANLNLVMIVVACLTACSDEHERTTYSTETVEIVLLEAASSGQVNAEVEVHVRTANHDGCWRDIEVELVQDDNRHFSLKATGTFIQYPDGACPQNLVLEDTIIRFTPVIAGEHYIKANHDPLTILRDTVEVN